MNGEGIDLQRIGVAFAALKECHALRAAVYAERDSFFAEHPEEQRTWWAEAIIVMLIFERICQPDETR